MQGVPDSEAGEEKWYEAASFHFGYDSEPARADGEGLSSPLLRDFVGAQRYGEAKSSGGSLQQRRLGRSGSKEALLKERHREILGAEGGGGEVAGGGEEGRSLYMDDGTASSHSPGSGQTHAQAHADEAVALAQQTRGELAQTESKLLLLNEELLKDVRFSPHLVRNRVKPG